MTTQYENTTSSFDLEDFFKTEAGLKGYNKKVDFTVGQKTFTKYYKLVARPENPQRWQAERGCLDVHSVLAVVPSLTEAKQLAEALFPGETVIPLGFYYDEQRQTLQWLDGTMVDEQCHPFTHGDGHYGVYNGE